MTDYSPEAVASWMDEYGRTAYEAYRDSSEGRTPSGRLMPYWNDMGADARRHWTQAALAAVARHAGSVPCDYEGGGEG